MALSAELSPADLKKNRQDSSDDMGKNEQEEALRVRQEKIIQKVNEYVEVTFHELHAASRRQTDELLQGARMIKLDEKEISGWEDFVEHTLSEMKTSAKNLYDNQLMNPLLQALKDKAISERVIKKIQGDFQSVTMDYKEKEKYIRETLPKRLKEWRKIKDLRDDLVERPGIRAFKKDNITNFDTLFNIDAFANLKWVERKKLVETVDALYSARVFRTEELMQSVEEELIGYKNEKILHASKVSTWMQRIFTRNLSLKEINQYLEHVVRPNAIRWRKTKEDFKNLNKSLKKNGIPRGFEPVDEDEFLLWEYPKRTSYCALAVAQMNDPEGALETDKTLAAYKLRIRYCLNTKDWDEAQECLAKAETIAPEDPELRSMREYLKCHSTVDEDKNKLTPLQRAERIRGHIGRLPGSKMQDLYHQFAGLGRAQFHRWLQVMYNRVWVRRNLHWTDAEEKRRLQFVRTFGQQGKGNILDIKNMEKGEIVEQISLHADINAGKEGPNMSAKEHWGYWSTAIDEDFPYALQAEIVSVHWQLKQDLKYIEEAGFAYTSHDDLISLN